MDISTSITDEQAQAIAAKLRIAEYADGNDLIQQAAEAALFDYNKKMLVGSIIAQTDPAVIEAATSGYNSVASTPVTPLPPLKIKPTL